MTKQTIDIPGLPEGWEVKHVNVSGINFDNGLTSMKVPVIAHIRKNQPRRKLSAQEIAEDYDPSAPNGYD